MCENNNVFGDWSFFLFFFGGSRGISTTSRCEIEMPLMYIFQWARVETDLIERLRFDQLFVHAVMQISMRLFFFAFLTSYKNCLTFASWCHGFMNQSTCCGPAEYTTCTTRPRPFRVISFTSRLTHSMNTIYKIQSCPPPLTSNPPRQLASWWLNNLWHSW